MKRLFIAAALALTATPALAEPASYRIVTPEQQRASTQRAARHYEYAFLALSAVDGVITNRCLRRDTCEEINPLFGKRPSTEKIIIGKLVGGALHFAAFTYINDRNPRLALRAAQISVVAQGAVVAVNLRVAF